MRLHDLIRSVAPRADLTDTLDAALTGVRDDSRHVRPGDLFVARPGVSGDGLAYTADAVRRGAVAVVTQQWVDGLTVPQVVVPDAASVVFPLAHAFHGRPTDAVKTLAVTGTNGKTTTTYLIRHILNALGHRCGLVGTVELDDGRTQTEALMTTPSAVDVARLLGEMRDNGCRACAIEVSSHALHQGRTNGLPFAGAGFTNLTGDHLDYHGTMDAYADAKATLFDGLAGTAVAAVNADSPAAARMTRGTAGRVVTFGQATAADYRAADVAVTAAGTSFQLIAPDGRAEVHTTLVGRHNLENALCAVTLCCETFGLAVPAVASALATAAGAPGRLQPVPTGGRPFAVLVDYAHTDDALRNVLTALRPLTRGRLRVVFGCGGDRDRTKRPRMAAVAEALADDLYVTSDNPRTESPDAILAEIVAGLTSPRQARVEADRRLAIGQAIADAGPGDVVLIAGKGHENYQIVGRTKLPFDDVREAAARIAGQSAVAS